MAAGRRDRTARRAPQLVCAVTTGPHESTYSRGVGTGNERLLCVARRDLRRRATQRGGRAAITKTGVCMSRLIPVESVNGSSVRSMTICVVAQGIVECFAQQRGGGDIQFPERAQTVHAALPLGPDRKRLQ